MVQENPLKSFIFRESVIAAATKLLKGIDDSDPQNGTLVVAQVLDHGVLPTRVYSTIDSDGINSLIKGFNNGYTAIRMSVIKDDYLDAGIKKDKILLFVS